MRLKTVAARVGKHYGLAEGVFTCKRSDREASVAGIPH